MNRPPVNIYQAKARLSQLVEEAEGGTDVVIGRAGKPVARLTRLVPARRKIRFGVLRGRVRIQDDFDRPLPDDVLAGFGVR